MMENNTPAPSVGDASVKHASSEATLLDGELVKLCVALEHWTGERRAIRAAAPDEFPPFKRKAAWQALAFGVLYGLGMLELRFFKGSLFVASQLIVIACVTIALAAAFVLFAFDTHGVLTKRYWRAAFSVFRKTNYPFTPLIGTLDADLKATALLSEFSTHALSTIEGRLSAEESELKERLHAGIGNPTLLVLIGLLAAISSAWKSYSAEATVLTTSVFFGSIGALALSLETAGRRMELFELTRCRGLLALELARRRAPSTQISRCTSGGVSENEAVKR